MPRRRSRNSHSDAEHTGESHPSRRSRGGTLLRLATLAGLGAAGLSAYTAYLLNRPRRKDILDDYFISPHELQVPHENVSFVSPEGYELRGWLFRHANETRTVIGMSGRDGSKADLIGIGTAVWRAGFNVLLFDPRGRGESESGPQSIGYHELQDLRAARNFVRHNIEGARIGLLGYSMGAACSILLAAEDPRIRCVVADSSFASLGDLVADYYGRWHLPGRLMARLTAAWNRFFYNYSIADLSPEARVAEIGSRPLLIVHGERDGTTPAEHALRIHEAAGEKAELWLIPDVEHCGGYFADREGYAKRVAEFFEKSLQ